MANLFPSKKSNPLPSPPPYSMPYFAIDIGSNTILLLVKIGNTQTNYVQFGKLAENINQTQKISNAAIKRGKEILTRYRAIIQKVELANPNQPPLIPLEQRIKAVTTSALRDATNQTETITALEQALGSPIQVISPHVEAILTYQGSISDFTATSTPVVLDIGGGSTELIACIDKEIHTKSYKIGAVRFKDQFANSSQPLSELAKQNITARIDHLIDKDPPTFLTRLRKKNPNKPGTKSQPTLIGVAGIPTTLAAVKYNGREVDYEKIHLKSLTLDDLKYYTEMFEKLTTDEIIKQNIINSKRAEIMPVSCVILKKLMEKFNFDLIQVSIKGLRYGVMRSMEEKEATTN